MVDLTEGLTTAPEGILTEPIAIDLTPEATLDPMATGIDHSAQESDLLPGAVLLVDITDSESEDSTPLLVLSITVDQLTGMVSGTSALDPLLLSPLVTPGVLANGEMLNGSCGTLMDASPKEDRLSEDLLVADG